MMSIVTQLGSGRNDNMTDSIKAVFKRNFNQDTKAFFFSAIFSDKTGATETTWVSTLTLLVAKD
jgi:hypothetical protein